MKISIEKPKENIWKFPCLGISNSGAKVYFSDWKTGVIVESITNAPKIGHTSAAWDMDKFTPIDINGFELNKLKPIDWDKVELPIWVEDKDDIITQIVRISETEIRDLTITDRETIFQSRLFITPKQKTEYLKSLKVIPKGTKITFEL